MTNIQFSTGTYKEYQINGNGTIKVNVSDPNIIDRLSSCDDKIDKIVEKYGDKITAENAGPIDREIRALVDDVLNCPGACDVAFGNVSSVAIVDGTPLFETFLTLLIEQLKKDIRSTAAADRIKLDENTELNNERTQKYITQTKPVTLPASALSDGAVGSVDLALLSQAERERLLSALLAGEPK
jgi:hypothetical protein